MYRSRTIHFAKSRLLVAIGLALMSATAAAHAQTNLQPATSAPDASLTRVPSEQVRARLQATIADLIASGAFGNATPHEVSFDLASPGQRVGDLGVLVDSASTARDGLHVLGVTPGSAAEKMGVRAGDVLLDANGAALDGGAAEAARRLRGRVDALPEDGALALRVVRGGQSHTLSGTLDSVYVPAFKLHVGDGVALASVDPDAGARAATAIGSACGRISDFDVAPRQQQLHAAKIIAIDGKAPGPSGSTSFRVTAGPHVVTVYNLIESRYLPFNDAQRNSGLTSSHYKKLQVEVAPDTTTFIAARLNEDKRNDPFNDAYWDPVAWKQSAEVCR